MKNLKEEDIDSILFNSLAKEPELYLPHGFEIIVARKVSYSKPLSFKVYGIAILTAILVFGIAICMLKLSKTGAATELLSFLSQFKYLILSILLVVLGIEYLDQKFVRFIQK